LADLHWFRADWQRGGAATGFAQFEENGESAAAMAKLPIPPQELRWLERLQPQHHAAGDVVPRLLASGWELGGYDLAWVVMERLPHGPLDASWQGQEWDHLIDALVRFQQAASAHPVDQPPRDEDWSKILRRSREHLRDSQIADVKQWNHAIKAVQKKLPEMMKVWNDRDVKQWCHGDVHLGNAMTRVAPPNGPALLFDLAAVHAGHWVEDAIYLEHLFWAHPQRVGDRKLTNQIARTRKKTGLRVEEDWPVLARIRRVLLAAAGPAYAMYRGDPSHLAACRQMIESNLHALP
jgi:hypothetical protein